MPGKRVQFDDETWQALDRMMDFQELADEAFQDLLKKHGRPTDLKSAIGLGLTLIHLISIPVTNTSVNPARSIGPALFAGSWAIGQLWLFIVAPIVGGALGGVLYRSISEQKLAPVVGDPKALKPN